MATLIYVLSIPFWAASRNSAGTTELEPDMTSTGVEERAGGWGRKARQRRLLIREVE